MTALALGLVLLAALAHATWNLLAKQASDKLAFLWGATLVAAALYLPIGLWLFLTHPSPTLGWAIVSASTLLEAFYFWSLAQAYRYGDLSLVYPVARGIGPLVVPVLGVALLGERLSALAALGILLIVVGVLVVHLPTFGWSGARALLRATRHPGTRYAALTGLLVASYSTLDKRGVALMSPLLYVYVLHLGSALALSALLLPRRTAAAKEWRRQPWRVAAVGLMTPLTYGLVLAALTFTPVSYVVPAREVSIVFAALLGTLVLREPFGPQRVAGSALIACGLFLLVAG